MAAAALAEAEEKAASCDERARVAEAALASHKHAALTAVGAEQRQRQAEGDELRRRLHQLSAKLEDETVDLT
jgi:hypothetical protein